MNFHQGGVPMGFPDSVAIEALTSCGRCCCICHKFCGTKIELHHIKQKAYGGEDSLDNCIPLCFDCHSDMGKADPNHPKGKRYSTEELIRHRDNWYQKVDCSGHPTDNNDKTVRKDDLELFQKICALFTPSVKYWLVEKDLGGSHPYSVFQPLAEYLLYIDDPFSEFIDAELEKMRCNLNSSINKFLSYKSTNTFMRDFNGESRCVTHQWMVEHDDWEPHSMNYEEYTFRFAEEVHTLNNLATALWNTYCEFARQGRYRLAQ